MKPSPQSIVEHFHHPKGNFIPVNSPFPVTSISPSPRQSPVCFLSLDLPLLNTSYKWSRMICRLLWLKFLLSIMFSRFIQVETYISTSFLLMNSMLCGDIFEVCFHFMGSLYFPRVHSVPLPLLYPYERTVLAQCSPYSLETVTSTELLNRLP